MKKYVLSAVVSGLLVPSLYAMDGGAAPPAEVEVPAVETPVVDHVVVDLVVAVDPGPVEVGPDVLVEVTPTDATVGAEELKPEVCPVPECLEHHIHHVDLGAPDQHTPNDENVVDPQSIVDLKTGEEVKVDENGNLAVCYFGSVFLEAVDENGNPIPVCTMAPVEGELTDPNMVDLASQSGVAIDDGAVHPNVSHVLNDSTGVQADGVVNSAEEVTPIRYSMSGGIQPNFRGGITERGADALATSTLGIDSDASNPQQLNDEQRGAVRHQRADEEPAKPRTGMGKLFAKFHKAPATQSQVSPASLTETDKALASQLAQIDRMRDTALRTGDQKALAKADKMEKELRAKSSKVTKVTKISTRTK